MKYLLIYLLFASILQFSITALTEAQIKSTVKLMQNTCKPKTKATDAQIDDMHKGIWNYEKSSGCYMFCCLKMMKVVNVEGKLDIEIAKTLIPTLPEPRRQPTLNSVINCNELIDQDSYHDKCLLAFEVAKCIYTDNPNNYFLP